MVHIMQTFRIRGVGGPEGESRWKFPFWFKCEQVDIRTHGTRYTSVNNKRVTRLYCMTFMISRELPSQVSGAPHQSSDFGWIRFDLGWPDHSTKWLDMQIVLKLRGADEEDENRYYVWLVCVFLTWYFSIEKEEWGKNLHDGGSDLRHSRNPVLDQTP